MGKTLTLVATAALSLALAGAADAKTCKSFVGGGQTGPNPTRALAQSIAINKWQIAVTQKHSLQYANWGNASSKKVSCSTKTTIVGANAYRCIARAKPCVF